MYSLTKTTDILLSHYYKWIENTSSKEIFTYNSHKLRHTIWVLEIGRLLLIKIGKDKEISQEIKNKSEIAFICHDFWRFYQNDKEKVLSNKEFEHWDYWYELTKKSEIEESIALGVKYHNKYSSKWLYDEESYLKMTEQEKKETEFLVDITKDADKLQNMLYMLLDDKTLWYKIMYEWNNWKKLSKEVLEDFKKYKLIDNNKVKSIPDKILNLFSWVFDFNFKESYEILDFFSFEEKIFNELKNYLNQEELEEVKKILSNFKQKT